MPVRPQGASYHMSLRGSTLRQIGLDFPQQLVKGAGKVSRSEGCCSKAIPSESENWQPPIAPFDTQRAKQTGTRTRQQGDEPANALAWSCQCTKYNVKFRKTRQSRNFLVRLSKLALAVISLEQLPEGKQPLVPFAQYKDSNWILRAHRHPP